MRIWIMIAILLLLVATASRAEDYLGISVTSILNGQEYTSTAKLFSVFDGNEPFSTGSTDHVKLSWVALNLHAVKTAIMGLNGGTATAYIWSGTQVTVDSPFSVIVNTTGTAKWLVKLVKYDGTAVLTRNFENIDSFGFDLLAVPAGLQSWQTKGYKLTVLVVPEPSTRFILLIGIFSATICFGRKSAYL